MIACLAPWIQQQSQLQSAIPHAGKLVSKKIPMTELGWIACSTFTTWSGRQLRESAAARLASQRAPGWQRHSALPCWYSRLPGTPLPHPDPYGSAVHLPGRCILKCHAMQQNCGRPVLPPMKQEVLAHLHHARSACSPICKTSTWLLVATATLLSIPPRVP